MRNVAIARSAEVLTVADVVNIYTVDGKNQELLRRAVVVVNELVELERVETQPQ